MENPRRRKKKWILEIIINFLAGQPGTPQKVGQQSQIPLEFPSFSGDFQFFTFFFQSKQLLIIGAPVAAKENTFFFNQIIINYWPAGGGEKKRPKSTFFFQANELRRGPGQVKKKRFSIFLYHPASDVISSYQLGGGGVTFPGDLQSILPNTVKNYVSG